MTPLRALLWACSLVFAAWATAEAGWHYLETREIEWILGVLVGVGLFGVIFTELGMFLQGRSRDD